MVEPTHYPGGLTPWLIGASLKEGFKLLNDGSATAAQIKSMTVDGDAAQAHGFTIRLTSVAAATAEQNGFGLLSLRVEPRKESSFDSRVFGWGP
jgi:hypothetical protein